MLQGRYPLPKCLDPWGVYLLGIKLCSLSKNGGIPFPSFQFGSFHPEKSHSTWECSRRKIWNSTTRVVGGRYFFKNSLKCAWKKTSPDHWFGRQQLNMDTPRESHDLKYTVQQKPWLYYVEKKERNLPSSCRISFFYDSVFPKRVNNKNRCFYR